MYFPSFFSNFCGMANGFYYTIQEGDNLEILSNRYRVPVNLIIVFNKITYPYTLNTGDKLFIPGADEPLAPADYTIYTVKMGDTIEKIAKQFNISENEILNKNYMSSKNMLYIGQKLLISQKNTANNISNTSDIEFKETINSFNRFPVLRKGSKGNDVIKLQRLIGALGYGIRKVDGIFNSDIETAVRNIQKESGIKVTGEVNASTWEYIFEKLSKVPGNFI